MFNDPLGDKADYSADWAYIIYFAQNYYGGSYNANQGWSVYNSNLEGFYAGAENISRNGIWGLYDGWASDYMMAAGRYNSDGPGGAITNVSPGGYITTGIFYHNADGTPKTIDGMSGYFTTYFVGNRSTPANTISNMLSAFESWFKSMQSKDGSIGIGWTFYNNSNTSRADLDNDLKPSAKKTESLGDISTFLNMLGMSSKNPTQYNPLDYADALDALANPALKMLEKNNKKLNRSYVSNLVIDNQRGDTVTLQRWRSRSKSAQSSTSLYRNPDGTYTTSPKNP